MMRPRIHSPLLDQLSRFPPFAVAAMASVVPGVAAAVERATQLEEERTRAAVELAFVFGVTTDDAKFALFLTRYDKEAAANMLRRYLETNAWPNGGAS